MSVRTEMWVLFAAVVGISLAVDLSRQSRRPAEKVSITHALKWSLFWIGLSLAFNAVVFVTMGVPRGTEFLTAYLIEKSLSVDNLFVFMLILITLKFPVRISPKFSNTGFSAPFSCAL